MSTKIMILFASSTQPPLVPTPSIGYVPRVHTGGWSELLWHNSDTPTVVLNALQNPVGGNPALLPSRANCLPVADSIIGVRLYQGATGRGQSVAISYPGGYTADEIPQMGLLIKGGAYTVLNTRRWIIRGIPDDSVVGGEFAPTTNFAFQIAQLFKAYDNFGFYANNLTLPVAKLAGIDAGGNCSVISPLPTPFVVGDRVKIIRAVDVVTGLFRRYTGTIATVTNPNMFQVVGWTGNAANGGTAAKQGPQIFCELKGSTLAAVRIVTRKVGRPFELYHGRRSKRRKTA